MNFSDKYSELKIHPLSLITVFSHSTNKNISFKYKIEKKMYKYKSELWKLLWVIYFSCLLFSFSKDLCISSYNFSFIFIFFVLKRNRCKKLESFLIAFRCQNVFVDILNASNGGSWAEDTNKKVKKKFKYCNTYMTYRKENQNFQQF